MMTLPKTFPMRAWGGKTIQVPSIGYGTCMMEDPVQDVVTAIQAGYRHIDCAWEYGNEAEIGEGIRKSGVPREELFVTGKLFASFAAPEHVALNIDQTLQAMGLEYLDLYLIHWPMAVKSQGDLNAAKSAGVTHEDKGCAVDKDGMPVAEWKYTPKSVAAANGAEGNALPTWNAMKALVRSGKARAVGVSNYERQALKEILDQESDDDVPLSCNQIEGHPWFQDDEVLALMKEKGVLATVYCPFAPIYYTPDAMTPFKPTGVLLLQHPTVLKIAEKTGMSTGQVLQSWAVQRGTIPLGRSSKVKRMKENLDVQKLSEEDFQSLVALKLEGYRGKSMDFNSYVPTLKFPQS